MPAEPDPADTAAPAPRLVREVAAETLRVLAWILTPEDGYEPPDNPIPQLLRKVACRLLESHPARGTVRCEQAAEAASTAAQFVLAVRQAPGPDQVPAPDPASVLTRLESVPRTTLPDALLAAARLCQQAPDLGGPRRPDPRQPDTRKGNLAWS